MLVCITKDNLALENNHSPRDYIKKLFHKKDLNTLDMSQYEVFNIKTLFNQTALTAIMLLMTAPEYKYLKFEVGCIVACKGNFYIKNDSSISEVQVDLVDVLYQFFITRYKRSGYLHSGSITYSQLVYIYYRFLYDEPYTNITKMQSLAMVDAKVKLQSILHRLINSGSIIAKANFSDYEFYLPTNTRRFLIDECHLVQEWNQTLGANAHNIQQELKTSSSTRKDCLSCTRGTYHYGTLKRSKTYSKKS